MSAGKEIVGRGEIPDGHLQVDVHVHRTRDHQLAGGIDLLGPLQPFPHLGDLFAADADIGLDFLFRGDNGPVLDNQVERHTRYSTAPESSSQS